MQWFVEHQELILAILGYVVGIAGLALKIARDFKQSQADNFWSYLLDKGQVYLRQLQADAVREITSEDVGIAAFFIWDSVPEKVTALLVACGFSRGDFADLLWKYWQDWTDAQAGFAQAGLLPPR